MWFSACLLPFTLCLVLSKACWLVGRRVACGRLCGVGFAHGRSRRRICVGRQGQGLRLRRVRLNRIVRVRGRQVGVSRLRQRFFGLRWICVWITAHEVNLLFIPVLKNCKTSLREDNPGCFRSAMRALRRSCTNLQASAEVMMASALSFGPIFRAPYLR